MISSKFLRLWIGSSASGFSTWGLTFLLGLAMAHGAISASMLGIMLAVRTVAFLIGVVIGGNLADRKPRRLVILYASLLAATGIPMIMVAIQLSGAVALILYFIGAALSGLGQGGCRPGYQAFIPIIVPAEHRKSANAAMGLSVRFSVLIGPAVTSLLAISVGLSLTFFILCVTWLLSAIVPPWVDERNTLVNSASNKASAWRQFFVDLREGFDEAREHPWILGSLVALTSVIAAGYSATNVILPVISEQQTGGSHLLSAAVTSYTIGGIIGALLIARISPSRVGWVALISMATYSFAPLGLLMSHYFYVVLLCYVVAGIGIEIFNVIWFTALQNEVKPDRLARVSSLDFLCSYGLAPLGLSIIAPLTKLYGIEPVLITCWLISLAVPLLMMLVPSSRYYSTAKSA